MRQGPLNSYRVSVESNQAGKYDVRLEARYAGSGWALRVYFQVSTPERLSSRLLGVLRYLQRHEEELWMWGSSPSDRGLLFDELLREAGLEADRRRDFPRGGLLVTARPGESLRPLQLAELKRKLAERLAAAARVSPRTLEAVRSA